MEELSEMIRKYLTYLDELMVSDEKDCISLEDQQRLSCLRGKLLSYWEVNNNLQDLISQNMIKIRSQIRKYEYKQAEIEKKICELKVKLEEKGILYGTDMQINICYSFHPHNVHRYR